VLVLGAELVADEAGVLARVVRGNTMEYEDLGALVFTLQELITGRENQFFRCISQTRTPMGPRSLT